MKTLHRLAILIFATRWFCFHNVVILRNDGARMWTWCLDCGHESEGVQFRGPEVA
jgi:hypothetical protein